MAQTAKAWLNDLTSLYTPTATEFDAARTHRAANERSMKTAEDVAHGGAVDVEASAKFVDGGTSAIARSGSFRSSASSASACEQGLD